MLKALEVLLENFGLVLLFSEHSSWWMYRLFGRTTINAEILMKGFYFSDDGCWSSTLFLPCPQFLESQYYGKSSLNNQLFNIHSKLWFQKRLQLWPLKLKLQLFHVPSQSHDGISNTFKSAQTYNQFHLSVITWPWFVTCAIFWQKATKSTHWICWICLTTMCFT